MQQAGEVGGYVAGHVAIEQGIRQRTKNTPAPNNHQHPRQDETPLQPLLSQLADCSSQLLNTQKGHSHAFSVRGEWSCDSPHSSILQGTEGCLLYTMLF